MGERVGERVGRLRGRELVTLGVGERAGEG